MTWLQVGKTVFSLERNMGEVIETLYNGWLPVVMVNGVTTKLPYAPDADAAKKLIEDYWEAAWALKPETR